MWPSGAEKNSQTQTCGINLIWRSILYIGNDLWKGFSSDIGEMQKPFRRILPFLPAIAVTDIRQSKNNYDVS